MVISGGANVSSVRTPTNGCVPEEANTKTASLWPWKRYNCRTDKRLPRCSGLLYVRFKRPKKKESAEATKGADSGG